MCKDTGGTAGIVPVVKAIRSHGAQVELFANGKAVEILAGSGEVFVQAQSVETLLAMDYPKTLVTSMCSQGGVGRDLILYLRKSTQVVALQDYWAGYLYDAWRAPDYRPDYIIVNDGIGARLVEEAWPGFPSENIRATGFPALDKYAGYDVAAEASKVRLQLGIPPQGRIVLYGGQWQGSGSVLAEIVRALNELGDNSVYLIPRAHPAMGNNAPDELPIWQEAIKCFSGGILVDGSGFSTQQLLAASDVILSMYSTILVESATIRKQTISVLYPDAGLSLFRASTGNSMDVPPVVSLGCSTMAAGYEELCSQLKLALKGDLGLTAAQVANFRLDGQNAERSARFILSLL